MIIQAVVNFVGSAAFSFPEGVRFSVAGGMRTQVVLARGHEAASKAGPDRWREPAVIVVTWAFSERVKIKFLGLEWADWS